MFAVPGWSVSTSELKRQTGNEPRAKAAPSAQNGEDSTEAAPKPGKNKRKQTDLSNVEELWKKHVEGQNGLKQEPKKENAKKRKLEKKEAKRKDKPAQEKDEKQPRSPKDKTNGAKPASSSKPKKPSKSHDDKQPGQRPNKNDKAAPKPKDKQKPSKNEQRQQEEKPNDEQPPSASTIPAPAKLTPLQQAMRQKLLGARFRYLNEQLYTTPSKQAFELFSSNPEFFAEYHNGFTRQVQEVWPSNPVDGYIRYIQERAPVQPNHNKNKKQSTNRTNDGTEALPRRPNGLCTISDLGCGDAKLAHSLVLSAKKLRLKFHSFDLHSSDSLVTKADVANLPLGDGTVDVAIFCLSLMGTNWVSFVEEAWRVLRGDGKGECWVSEVKSRFGKVTRVKKTQTNEPPLDKRKQKNKKNKKDQENDEEDENVDDANIFAEDAAANSADQDTDISAFVAVFRSRGFVLKERSVDKSNKMFVKMEFVKHGAPTKGKYAGVAGSQAGKGKKFIEKDPANDGMTPEEESQVLKPCLYKTRFR